MSINTQDIENRFNEAISKHQSGDIKSAKSLYEGILADMPSHVQTLSNLGMICKMEKNYTQSLQYLQKALDLDAQNLPALNNMANLYREMHSYDKAIDLGKKIIELTPDDPTSYNNLAITYEMQKMYTDAFEMYQKAIQIDKTFAKAYNNIGVLLYRQGRYNDAIVVFETSLREAGDTVQTLCNAGAVYNKAKRYEDAQNVLQKAISLDHNATGAYVNLGNVYNKVNRHLDALACHTKALEFDPNSASNHANLAITYKHLERYDEAIQSFQKAIQINPDFTNAHFDLATTYLLLGDYENGFKEYEWRFQKEEMATLLEDYSYIFDKPKFTLESETKEKTLLLYSEQGFGDIIQFIRFAKPLKERFDDLTLKVQCREPLKKLFSTVDFIDEVVSRDEDVGAFDYQYAIMSLPYLLGVEHDDIPHEVYIPEQNMLSLEVHPYKYNIGLVWGGSVTGESYPQKIFSPKDMSVLMDHEDIGLYSLQVGKEDVQTLRDLHLHEDQIVDLSNRLSDFQKTASAIKTLDLVITSDTAVAHLAGALGKEVWILLMKKADWRWGLESDQTPWYPSARLFRQKEQGVWDSVFEEIFCALEEKYSIDIPRG